MKRLLALLVCFECVAAPANLNVISSATLTNYVIGYVSTNVINQGIFTNITAYGNVTNISAGGGTAVPQYVFSLATSVPSFGSTNTNGFTGQIVQMYSGKGGGVSVDTTGNKKGGTGGFATFSSGAGGAAIGTSSPTGGYGGRLNLYSGSGQGVNINATNSNTGGNSGDIYISPGNGGSVSGIAATNLGGSLGSINLGVIATAGATAANGTNYNTGGNGYTINLADALGGDATGGAGTTNRGGNGSIINLATGAGGAGNGGAAYGGNGGAITLTTGAGGGGATAGGNGGNIRMQAGIAAAGGTNGIIRLESGVLVGSASDPVISPGHIKGLRVYDSVVGDGAPISLYNTDVDVTSALLLTAVLANDIGTQVTAGTLTWSKNSAWSAGDEDSNFDINVAANGSLGQGLKITSDKSIYLFNKVYLQTGSNKSLGTSTLVGGTVTVATTSVSSTSKIFLTPQTTYPNTGFLSVSNVVASTSFTIWSSNAADTNQVAWMIFTGF